MSEAFHEIRLDETAFLHATAAVKDLEYEYVIDMVGEAGMIRDIAIHHLANQAVRLLQYAGLDDFQADITPRYSQDESSIETPSLRASMDYFDDLAGKLDAINGYRLSHLDYSRIILDKTTYSLDTNAVSITIEASYSPSGVYVAKDQHTLGRREVETIPLPVEPRDVGTMVHFIRRLTDLD